MVVWIISWKVGYVSLYGHRLELTPMIGDTVLHSWEVLAKILESPDTDGILCDIGMYVYIFIYAF